MSVPINTNNVYFCALCVEKWRDNKWELWDIRETVGACTICGSFLCEAHSLYESDTELRRCRDKPACRAATPDQDEGGGS